MMNTVFEKFELVAKLHADRPALISDARSLSYRELAARATKISWLIRRWYLDNLGRDVCATDVVGVSLPKCIDLYATILGILRAGASYVPLDPELAPDIRRHIAERCRCNLSVVDDEGILGDAPWQGYATVPVGESAHATFPAVGERSARNISTDTCYTIFTSGSTGKPKGVTVHHGNLMNLVNWTHAQFDMGVATRALQYSTINFDASVLDIFPTILSGGALCIPTAEQRLSAAQLSSFCRLHRINHAFLPPSLLAVLDPASFDSIEILLTGGEACSPEVVERWSFGRRLFNLFGPTECTVLAACKEMRVGVSPRNIGMAITGVRLHVLDEKNQPTNVGELHIAGVAVAPGYVGDDPTTTARFIRLPAVDSSVLYKTGDVVECDAGGELHFIGRKDRQIKVRGYRIELEEIEGALLSLGCREAAVKVSIREALIAYINADASITDNALKLALEQRLGIFKVPHHIVRMLSLPTRNSGKIDYQALPEVTQDESVAETVLPEDPCYVALAALWKDELGVDARVLSVTSNFRDLGATSINFVSLLGAIEDQFGVPISFIDFFRNPTLEFLHQSIQQFRK